MQDKQEDVRAVSAEALLPVTHLLSGLDGSAMQQLRSALWQVLEEVDDLSPATGALPASSGLVIDNSSRPAW
jgi:hypothetical protein